MQLGRASGMKVLVDECAQQALKKALVSAGYGRRLGWSGKENGELLTLADVAFDILVMVDQNIRYQQTMSGRKIALVILCASSNRLVDLERLFPACIEALRSIPPGTVIEVGLRS